MSILEYDLPGTSTAVETDSAGGSTSNMFLPKLGDAVLPAFLALELLKGGTSASTSQASATMAASIRPFLVLLLAKPDTQEASESFLPALANSVRSLRRRSGLTWDELASIFGVSRRTLHNWSTGGQVSASHARAIASVIAVVHDIDTGDAKLTRSRLLAPAEDGTSPYTRLANQLRAARGRPALSYRPEELLGAHHDSPDPTGQIISHERLT
jgi:DNA-binding transcriptional regulator YiaG